MSSKQEQEKARRAKRDALIASGNDPYPARAAVSHALAEVTASFDALLHEQRTITVAGRLLTVRHHGGSTFLTINDGTVSFQAYMKKDTIGAEQYAHMLESIDLGDFVECAGVLMKTQRGEPTLLVSNARLLTKSLLPLPEKWHGLQDVEARYRQRYLDLIANPKSKNVFVLRAKITSALRSFLDERGFVEVQTPTLQPLAGGTSAKPFVTHHKTLDIDLFLRIAPELYLKELVIGGMPRVYEIATCFRNEGMDTQHNPEFTQVEFYAAYWDYERLMECTEDMLLAVADHVVGSSSFSYQGMEIRLTKPFRRLDYREALVEHAGIDVAQASVDALRAVAKKHGVPFEKSDGKGKLMDALAKKLLIPDCIQPTFLMNHPVQLSPLAKKIPKRSGFVERFQTIIAGMELNNAYSELNDPVEQEERFSEQEALRSAGDEEAQQKDSAFIEALKYGLPPTAGFGMGIDRLTMLLTDSPSIKDVLLFPMMRHKGDKNHD